MNIIHRSLPKSGHKICGDGVFLSLDEEASLIAVIDGVGHGEAAAEAVAIASDILHAYRELPLEELLALCDKELRGCVGVCIGLMRVLHVSHQLQAAIVGNVEVTSPNNAAIRPVPFAGILGSRFRKVTMQTFSLSPGDRILAFTDGISRSLVQAHMLDLSLTEVVDLAIDSFGKEHDDATCLAIEY